MGAYFAFAAFLLLLSSVSLASDSILPNHEVIYGPSSKKETESWLEGIRRYRTEELSKLNYSGKVYDTTLLWTSSSFVQPQMMIHDRYFYDPKKREYTVDRYLDDVEKRYGGIDSVLVWPGYPNIGIDNRNQYDMWRSMPGGLKGIASFVEDFQRRNVQVLFPWYPWDCGTRDEGKEGSEVIPALLKETGIDGFNCDTCFQVPAEFWTYALEIDYPIALEPEGGGDETTLEFTKMSWGYWDYPFIPAIGRWKWLETRHMTNICQRWAKDRTDQLQHAFMNGCGYESWENVWSIWMGITPRNAEALRRISAIERHFRVFLQSKDWTPHVLTVQEGVFASLWPGENSLSRQSLLTMVNRNSKDVSGTQIEVAYSSGLLYYDVYHGVELQPSIVAESTATLSFAIEASGYGCVFSIPSAEVGPELLQFLKEMAEMTQYPLSHYSNDFEYIPQTLIPISKTTTAVPPLKGMIRIPEAKAFVFQVQGIEIEGGEDGVDFQYPWESSPSRSHNHTMDIDSFYIDKYTVTNEDFQNYLNQSGYVPADPENFLKDWVHGEYPTGADRKPVTWVSMDDARSYCRYYAKRLPNEWEWQYAGSGTDQRVYPWGDQFDRTRVPAVDRSRNPRLPDDVDAHPTGDSPFGVSDLVGNIWQWTNEFEDEHTRSGCVKGGSLYHPRGDMWYFPNTNRLNIHGKFLLMADSYDRCGYVGFRCVVDVE